MATSAEYRANQQYEKAFEYVKEHPYEESSTYFAQCSNISVCKETIWKKTKDPEDRKLSIQYANIVKRKYLDFYQTHIIDKKRFAFLNDVKDIKGFMLACRNSLDVLARMGDFDAFAIAVEFYRPEEEKFYLPRRQFFMNLETVQGEVVNVIKDAQDFVDGKLDFLFFAMPQRSGKTTLCAFILVYRAFKNLSRSTFGLGHSTELANHFFDLVCLFFGTDGSTTFRTLEIFEGHKVAFKNKEYRELDIDEKHAFPNFAYKSIDGQITGSTEASLTAYADDLVKELNEVVNMDIADAIWTKVNTYIFGRKKKGVPVLGAATLWGDACPFTRYINHIKKTDPFNPRVRIRQFAWCNSQGESQFDYYFDLGFDTKHFLQLKSTMEQADKALWEAMYMSNPIPRQGRPLSDLDFYYDLPEEKPDYIACAIDTATAKAGDNWSAPMGYFYEKTRQVFIEDVVYTNEGAEVSIPKTVEMCLRHKPIQMEFEEKEAVGGRYKSGLGEAVRKLLQEKNLKPYIRTHSASGQQSKRARIQAHTSSIKGIPVEGLWTLHFNQKKYEEDRMYRKFVSSIMNWSEADRAQKSQEDDGADSCAMLLTYLTIKTDVSVKTFKASSLFG